MNFSYLFGLFDLSVCDRRGSAVVSSWVSSEFASVLCLCELNRLFSSRLFVLLSFIKALNIVDALNLAWILSCCSLTSDKHFLICL